MQSLVFLDMITIFTLMKMKFHLITCYVCFTMYQAATNYASFQKSGTMIRCHLNSKDIGIYMFDLIGRILSTLGHNSS